MKMPIRALSLYCDSLHTTNISGQAQQWSDIDDRFANINGVRFDYLIAGKGDPVLERLAANQSEASTLL